MRPRSRRYGPLGNQLVQSDVGRDDPPRVADNKPPKAWEQRQAAAAEQQTAVLNAWNQVAAHLGGILDLARAPAKGDVNAQLSLVIPSSGYIQRGFPATFETVAVANNGSGTLTVAEGPAMTEAPTLGGGLFTVGAGIWRMNPMRGTVVTVYGAAGSAFDLTVLSRPRPPAVGPLAASGSSPALPAGPLVAAGATTSQAVDLPAITYTRLVVVLNVSAAAGGSVTLTINGVTPSGYVYPILDPLAVTAVGVIPYRVGAALTPSPNAVSNDIVPDLVQVVATVTGSITYGIDYLGGK